VSKNADMCEVNYNGRTLYVSSYFLLSYSMEGVSRCVLCTTC